MVTIELTEEEQFQMTCILVDKISNYGNGPNNELFHIYENLLNKISKPIKE
jgi:hypothetical protein